jgi:hypothetical protein
MINRLVTSPPFSENGGYRMQFPRLPSMIISQAPIAPPAACAQNKDVPAGVPASPILMA